MEDSELKARLRQELAQLTALDGVSGHEQAVVRRLRDLMEPLADRVEVDALGNLYATRDSGDAPHLMVAAHSDEIGGLVAAIEAGGWLRLQTVGGVSEAMLVGRKVRVRGVLGVVGVRPGHLQSESERRMAPELEQLYVDLGFDSADDVAAIGIRPGDQITWQSELEAVANEDRVVGKGIDNRISCLLAVELLRSLKGQSLAGPLTVVVAVQEEVGLKGARVAAERVRPDCALVVDTTPCADTPDSQHVHTFPARLGRGPVLQVSSGRQAGGFILLESVRDYLIGIAEAERIPYQLAPFAYGNTDAASIYVSAGGIPTAAVTIPRRYSHSPVEMLDLNDAVAALRLCRAVVEHVGDFPRGILQQP
jgi:endoglucanase